MNRKNEKNYTPKSVKSELSRLEKSREKKKEKIKVLTAELKEDNNRMKELEKIFDELYHEDLQQKIATLWFKEEKMTGEQIAKFLEISKQLHDKIDILDVQTVVKAVTYVYNRQHSENSEKESEKNIPESSSSQFKR